MTVARRRTAKKAARKHVKKSAKKVARKHGPDALRPQRIVRAVPAEPVLHLHVVQARRVARAVLGAKGARTAVGEVAPRRMMAVAGRFAPRQQIYSIDECFLDFEGVRGDLVAIGRKLRAAVLREVGLPTSVGFGSTKTLAKLANHGLRRRCHVRHCSRHRHAHVLA